MNRESIKAFLPHREPMLLVDQAVLVGESTACGSYTVQGTEWFLKGHFPGRPVVPGVILCEIMAQTCCVLLGEKLKGKTPYFTSMNNVRFKHPVQPGDTIAIQCELTKEKGPFYFATGKASVQDKICAQGEFSFAIVQG